MSDCKAKMHQIQTVLFAAYSASPGKREEKGREKGKGDGCPTPTGNSESSSGGGEGRK